MACRGGDSRGRHYSDYPGVGANVSSCLHVLPCTLWRLNTQVAVFFSLSFKRLSSTAREHGGGGRAGGRGRGRTQIAFRKKTTMRSKPPKKKAEIKAPPRAMPGAAAAAAVASHLLAVAAALHAAGKFTRVPLLLGEKKPKKNDDSGEGRRLCGTLC